MVWPRDNFAFVPHVIFTDTASVFSYGQNPYKMQLTCYQTIRQYFHIHHVQNIFTFPLPSSGPMRVK